MNDARASLVTGENMPKVEINTPAPELSLEDYKGRQISLKEYRGGTVILVFNRSFL